MNGSGCVVLLQEMNCETFVPSDYDDHDGERLMAIFCDLNLNFRAD